jgi:DNA-binding response OmpR family regulator
MDLGAFAYLHKPVDINLLSCKLKEAHERAKNRKSTS